MDWHPYAKLFPMLPDDRLQDLADDIRDNGLKQPIVIDGGERIIDGRNRYRACEIAGVEPVFEPFTGSDEETLRYVISLNLHRRHLDESQRAMVAAEVATRKHGERGPSKKKEGSIDPSFGEPAAGVSVAEAADALSVGEASVKRARKVIDKGTPELQDAVRDGTVAVSRAAKLADKPPDEQVAEVEAAKAPKPKRPRPAAPVLPEPDEVIPPRKGFDLLMEQTIAMDAVREAFSHWPEEYREFEVAETLRNLLTEDMKTW